MASTVEIVIKGTDKASGAFGSANKAASGLEGTLGGLSKLGASVAKGVGIAAVGMIGLGGAAAGVLGKMAIDAAPLQGVADAFAGITGDASTMLDTLREGSLGMVKDADLMMSYNTAAQLVGKTFADQLPDAMGYLSKVSSATGQDMGFMMDSLVKGVGRLSPMILDNLGIQVSLEEATAKAADMFGIEADDLSKAQIQAGMMNVVMGKLAKNTEDMPDVAGTAAQKWATFGVTLQNFKDRIGVALIPVLQRILEPLSKLLEEHGPRLVELFETQIVPVIEQVADAFGMLLEGNLQGALTSLFGPDIAGQIMNFAGTIGELASTIGAFISDHAEEFKAAIIAIGAVLAAAMIATAIMGIVNALNPVTLAIMGIIAAAALLGAAWAGDWGGIRTTLTNIWENTLKPIFERLSVWLGENIPKVIAFLQDAWENVLLPAIKVVWAFLSEYVIPLLAALADVWLASAQKALEMIAAAWTNKVYPALKDLWDWLGKVAAIIGEKLQPVFDWLADKALPAIAGALGAVSKAVKDLIDHFKNVADAINNLSLPDWLMPGSPTPFELGLRGIADAMRDISRAQLPQLQAGLQLQMAGGAGMGMAGTERIIERGGNTYNLTINSSASIENLPADFAMLEAMAG
jgi:hypothetical protein